MQTRSDLKPRPKQRIPCFSPVYLFWGQINPDLVFCVNTTQQITGPSTRASPWIIKLYRSASNFRYDEVNTEGRAWVR